MKVAYCQHCGKETRFKRNFGFKTFFGLLITLGFWVIAMPLYTPRCTECGMKPQRSMERADILKVKQG